MWQQSPTLSKTYAQNGQINSDFKSSSPSRSLTLHLYTTNQRFSPQRESHIRRCQTKLIQETWWYRFNTTETLKVFIIYGKKSNHELVIRIHNDGDAQKLWPEKKTKVKPVNPLRAYPLPWVHHRVARYWAPRTGATELERWRRSDRSSNQRRTQWISIL